MWEIWSPHIQCIDYVFPCWQKKKNLKLKKKTIAEKKHVTALILKSIDDQKLETFFPYGSQVPGSKVPGSKVPMAA